MAAKSNKTLPSDASVQAYLDAIEDPARRADCVALCELMSRATRQPPQMWGSAIVGFGSYHYRYDSGREGDSCRVGFSSRKADITIYLAMGGEHYSALLAELGKHKAAKACLHIKRLADVQHTVLQHLVRQAYDDIGARHPG